MLRIGEKNTCHAKNGHFQEYYSLHQTCDTVLIFDDFSNSEFKSAWSWITANLELVKSERLSSSVLDRDKIFDET